MIDRFTPAAGNVLVEPGDALSRERITDSGLILPDLTPSQKASMGVVRRTGDESYPEGVQVVYSPYAGFSMKIADRTYVLMSGGEILGTFEGDNIDVDVR